MLKPCIVSLAALLLILPATAQVKRPTSKSGQSASSTTSLSVDKTGNPVKPTAESIALGKKYYAFDCAMCHGDTGDGKGSVAVDEGYNLKDFNDPATLKDRTDDDLFRSLKNGKGHMPLEQIRMTPNELWNLINYVRSLAKKTSPQEDAPSPKK